VKYDPDKKVWDQWELDQINAEGSGYPKLPYVKRMGTRQQFGIRAHRELDFMDCFMLSWWPMQNEFLPTLIYLGFALYFWVTVCLISNEVGIYGTLRDDNSTLQIFFVTFSIALSLSITAVFIIFYSRDFVSKVYLETIHFVGITLMVFACAFVFVLTELERDAYKEPILVGLGLIFVCCSALIFTFSKNIRIIGWVFAIIFLFLILLYDFLKVSGKRQKQVFYYTLPYDGSFVLLACVLYYFRIPEICSPNNKCLNLYFSSYIILIICTMNFLYEV
jgi:hypothetical protein